MSAARRFMLGLLMMTILLAPRQETRAQSSQELQYFPATGHTVTGEFLRFYRNAANPTLLFGDPITEQFTSMDGKLVQYFQRARFEWRPDPAGSGSIQLTPLGRATYRPSSQALAINNPSACRRFPGGQQVCFAFLDFYEANGGQVQFGDPLSPFEFHETLIVQYFERARFEWRADRPEGQRVVLTDLGRVYFDQLSEDPARLRPLRPLDATINPILSIQARAFIGRAITLATGRQTVHVFVQSQTRQPVADANGKATVRFPDGRSSDYFFTTNSAGLGSITFDFDDQTQGELVEIEILVTYQGLLARTTTSYRIWY